MHVLFVQYFYKEVERPEDLLRLHFTLVEWARALGDAGIQVSVVQRFHSNDSFSKDGTTYYFIKDKWPANIRPYHFAYSFTKKVRKIATEEAVDVIQVSNPLAISSNFLITRMIRNIPVVVQDHGSRLNVEGSLKKHLRKAFLRWSLHDASAVIFSAKGQEEPWLAAKILTNEQCFFVMENSSHFNYEERIKPRSLTGINGNPVFLWVGHLDANKDPITVLKAFIQVFEQLPKARLYMIYRLETIHKEVSELIYQYPILKENVQLLGSKTRDEISGYYNSADYIVAASHKEGSGYSVIEAMSCGVIPVLSRIPSFVSLTHDGKIGALFNAGDSTKLFDQIISLSGQTIEDSRGKVLAHFEKYFSFKALAENAILVYDHVCGLTDRDPRK